MILKKILLNDITNIPISNFAYFYFYYFLFLFTSTVLSIEIQKLKKEYYNKIKNIINLWKKCIKANAERSRFYLYVLDSSLLSVIL